MPLIQQMKLRIQDIDSEIEFDWAALMNQPAIKN